MNFSTKIYKQCSSNFLSLILVTPYPLFDDDLSFTVKTLILFSVVVDGKFYCTYGFVGNTICECFHPYYFEIIF